MTLDLRTRERDSIAAWVNHAADLGCFAGRVLDFGCGLSPYREIVQRAGGAYYGWDRADNPANVSGKDIGTIDRPLELDTAWDAILCTQVIQYVESPADLLYAFWGALTMTGYLVLTGPTNWPEVEPQDIHRHTRAGIRRLLEAQEFEVVELEHRAQMEVDGAILSHGYGIIARPA